MESSLRAYYEKPDSASSASFAARRHAHGCRSWWVSGASSRRRTWDQIALAWLTTFGRPCRNVEIYGDKLCATSVVTPCVQSTDLWVTISSARRGILRRHNYEVPYLAPPKEV